MIQQINLYLPEFRKKKDWLSFVNMVVLVCSLCVLLSLISAVKFFGIYSLRQDVSGRETEVSEARARTNALVDSYGDQGEDPRLAAEVQTLEENLEGKRALLNFLDGRYIGNVNGFSEYLADLARFHVNGLSLRTIDLQSGGQSVSLSGEVSQAEYVPLYLQNLRNGNSYNGMTFGALRMSEIASGDSLETRMTFNVSTAGSTTR